MADFQAYKVVIGTNNDVIYEDPILGSNGTAVVTKINNLIDALEQELNTTAPADIGYLYTIDINGNPIQIAPGTNGQCLIANNEVPGGLSYETRVDLYSDQTINGIKTFTNGINTNDANITNLSVTGNTVVRDISVNQLTASSNAYINGNTNIGGTLGVIGNTTIESTLNTYGNISGGGNLSVAQDAIIAGNQSVTGNSNIGGYTNINGTLSVTGTSNLGGRVTTGNDLSIGNNLTVNGGTNTIGNSVIGGSVSVGGTASINADLNVGGKVNAQEILLQEDLDVTRNLSIGGTLSTIGDSNLGGDVNVQGNEVINGNTSIGGTLSVTNGATIAGPSIINNDLSVTGDTNLGSTTITNQRVTGDTIIDGSATLNEGATIAGDIGVNGSASIGGTTNTDTLIATHTIQGNELKSTGNAYITGLTEIGGSATINGATTIGDSITVGNDASISGGLEVGNDALITGNVNTLGNTSTYTLDVGTDASVIGTTTLNRLLSNDTDITGVLSVIGNTNLGGPTSISNTLNVNGDTSLQHDLAVAGSINTLGNISANNLSGINTGDEIPATDTEFGIVKLTDPSTSPIVYSKESADETFINKSVINQPDGIAGLDSNGNLLTSQLPALAISSITTSNTEEEMLSSITQPGDIVIRSDLNKTFILKEEPATNPSNWVELIGPQAPVTSVFGRTGVISAALNDYTASLIGFDNNGTDLSSTTTRSALLEVYNKLNDHKLRIDNPHNITPGIINAISNDEKGIPNGVATLGMDGIIPLDQLPSTIGSYYQDFTSADLTSSNLVVVHNLGQTRVSNITVWSNENKVIIPDEITAIDENTITLSLLSYNSPTSITGIWTIRITK